VQAFLAHHHLEQWYNRHEAERKENRYQDGSNDDDRQPGPLWPDVFEYPPE
jgi:hypothetical protein